MQDDSCRQHLAVNRDIAFISRTHSPSSSLVLAATRSKASLTRMHVYTHLRRSSLSNAPRALLTDTPAASTLSEYVFQACHRTKIPAMHHHRPRIQPSPSIVRHSPRSSLLDHAHILAHQHATLQLLLLMNRQPSLSLEGEYCSSMESNQSTVITLVTNTEHIISINITSSNRISISISIHLASYIMH